MKNLSVITKRSLSLWLVALLVHPLFLPAFLIGLFSFPFPARAATVYYVRSGGTETNCTTIQTVGTPAGSLSVATACAGSASTAGQGANDIVDIGAGTFSGNGITNLPGGSSDSARFIIRGAGIGSTILNITGSDAAARCFGIESTNQDWITIQDLTCDGTNQGSARDGLKISNRTGVTLSNIEVKNFDGNGILANGSPSIKITGSWIHDNGASINLNHGIYFGNRSDSFIIEYNTIEGSYAHGVQIFDNSGNHPQNGIIQYNRIYDNNLGGITAYGAGNIIHHNEIFDNHQCAGSSCTGSGTGAKHGLNLNGFTNGFAFNNLIVNQDGSGDVGLNCASGTGVTIANNITLNNTTQISTSSCTGTISNNLSSGTQSDLFIDPSNATIASRNFSLKESSAAIDAGTTVTGYSGLCVSTCDQGPREAPVRASAVVEDATDTTYSITFTLPTQSTRSGTGLQTPTVGNFAVTVAAAGATESSAAISGTSRVDITLGAAVTVGQALTDAMTRSSSPTLVDNSCIGGPFPTACMNTHVRTYTAAAGTNNVDGGALPTLTQSRFRFHKLRGTEASPSLLYASAIENTSVTLPPGAAFRLRVKFRTDDDPAGTTYKLRYSLSGGAYTDIPDTMGADGIAWYGITSDTDVPSAGTATTELLTSDEASNTACAVVRSSSDFPILDLNNSEVECEYVLKASTSATGYFEFRVYRGDNTALDTYTVTPRYTVGSYTSFGF